MRDDSEIPKAGDSSLSFLPHHPLPLREPVELIVSPEHAGWRLDVFLAHHFPSYSRVHLRRVITAGGVRIRQVGNLPHVEEVGNLPHGAQVGNLPYGEQAGNLPSVER